MIKYDFYKYLHAREALQELKEGFSSISWSYAKANWNLKHSTLIRLTNDDIALLHLGLRELKDNYKEFKASLDPDNHLLTKLNDALRDIHSGLR